jgi:hypothetical protein
LLNGYNSEKVRVLDNLNFNPGIYFIKISSDKFFFTKKLIFN